MRFTNLISESSRRQRRIPGRRVRVAATAAAVPFQQVQHLKSDDLESLTDTYSDWGLEIHSSQPRDSGIYECQTSTTPHRSLFVHLRVVGKLLLQLSLASPLSTWGRRFTPAQFNETFRLVSYFAKPSHSTLDFKVSAPFSE